MGGAAAISTAGYQDAFVLALDATTGAAQTSFSGDGVQTFGGTSSDYGRGVAVSGGTVYVTGDFWSTNAGVGGPGTISTAGSCDAFVLALDATTGAAQTSFSGDGVQTFGGSDGDVGLGVVVSGGTVYVTGFFWSTNAGVGGAGAISTAGSNDAFVLALDATTGAAQTRFSGDGVQTFGGWDDDYGYGVAVSGGTLYVTGYFLSTNAGLGGAGAISTVGGSDAFVLALDVTTGAAQTGFSGDGVQTFGGSFYENGYGVAVSGGTVYVTGSFASTSAGVGGTGTYDATGWNGFLLPLDTATGGVPAPTGIAVDPNAGPCSGGQDVTVTGSGFVTGATVTFDISTVASNFLNTNTLTCVTPAHDLGPVGVTVTNPYGFTSAPGACTYFDNWEGDVAPRRIGGGAGGGDGEVSIADWVQIGRFAAALDPAVGGIEFQKADCGGGRSRSPRGRRGRFGRGLGEVRPVRGEARCEADRAGPHGADGAVDWQ